MDIQIKSENTKEISDITLKKMIFIFNALENGWSVTKNGPSYVFKKNIFFDWINNRFFCNIKWNNFRNFIFNEYRKNKNFFIKGI